MFFFFQEEIGEKIVKTLVHVKMEVVVNLTPVNAFVLQDGMVYTVKIHAIKTIMELIGKYYYLFSTKFVLLKKMQLLQSFFFYFPTVLINAIVKLVKDVITSQENVFHVRKEHTEWDALKSANAQKTALLFVYKPRVNVFVIQIFMEIGKVKIYLVDLKKKR